MKHTCALTLAILVPLLPIIAAPAASPLVVLADEADAPPLVLESDIATLGIELSPLTGREELRIDLNARAADEMYEYTSRNVGKTLAVLIDGAVVSRGRIREPVRGTMLLSGLKKDQLDSFAPRFPERLSIEKSDRKALLSRGGTALLFKPEDGKPGEYDAALEDGSSVKLHLIDAGYDEAAATGVRDKLRQANLPQSRLYETKNGLYLFYRFPLKDRSVPTSIRAVRGIMGTIMVGMELEPSQDQGEGTASDTADRALEAVLSALSLD